MFSRKKKAEASQAERNNALIESLLTDAFAEQKKARRWGILFKSLTFAYLFVTIMLFYTSINGGGKKGKSANAPHVAVVRVRGPIAVDSDASAAKINGGIRRAFEQEHAKAIILAINSPGGSPVQSAYVYDEIMRLKAKHPEKKVYAVIEDVGASGAYYIAAAADEIYANPASIVGSIGVIAAGFGFVDLIDKLGVERRIYSSGESKAFLDPFSTPKDSQVEYWQTVLDDVHQQFIDAVKAGRKDKLANDPTLFSGKVFNGAKAKELGLIDGLGSVRFVAREIIGEEKLRNYSHQKSPLNKVLENFGLSVGKGMASTFDAQGGLPELR